jgi:hypothetical protein
VSVIEATVSDEVSVIEVTVIEPTAGKRGTTMDATGKTTHTTTHATHMATAHAAHMATAAADEPAPAASADRHYSADMSGTHDVRSPSRLGGEVACNGKVGDQMHLDINWK